LKWGVGIVGFILIWSKLIAGGQPKGKPNIKAEHLELGSGLTLTLAFWGFR